MDAAAIEQPRNAEDFEYAVQMTRWLLQPLGIWPLKPSSRVALVLRPVSVGVCVFLLAFLLVPCCLHMFLIEKDIGVRLKMIGPLSFCLMNIFKYLAMLAKNATVASCIANMARDWHEVASAEYRRIYLENAKTARLFTTVCALFMYGGGLPYSTILPLTREAIVLGNRTFNHLAYPSYFIFFNPHVRPIYDLVFVTHCLCGFVMYSVTCGVCSIAILCIMHICSQCNVTSAMLQALPSSLDERSCSAIVRHHLRSLRFASKLEEILNEMCIVELLGCTFNICMLGYYFLTEYEQSEMIGTITYSLLLISLTFNIFIFCYIGDLLTENCQSLGGVAYTIDWYGLASVEARSIILIIASTQRPVVLTAGKMVTLSIQSFCNVVKAAATYLNMLRTLMANESYNFERN
ncbi:odorant receptor 4-like isoform X2 [Phymastichus coffea]|uniref:odorant receptor 4-like isoform X2 n=1 Tax=Phymastichus coffea TaxID=108790 RepID=UPI00273B20AB|nr:odorant receptor 4-like isoform X2 [Phymastichus coffea]